MFLCLWSYSIVFALTDDKFGTVEYKDNFLMILNVLELVY